MNYKNNPWLSLAALLLMALIIVLNCTGCTPAEATETEPAPAPRFHWEHVENDSIGGLTIIVTDNETGDSYLFIRGGYGGGICKMEG